MLSDKMKAAGVDVLYKNYDGVTHEFFGMAAFVPEAKEAQALAAGQLKKKHLVISSSLNNCYARYLSNEESATGFDKISIKCIKTYLIDL